MRHMDNRGTTNDNVEITHEAVYNGGTKNEADRQCCNDE